MNYLYVGTHWLCKLVAFLSLLWATPATGHTAVWLGASSGTDRWVQAGIADVPPGRTFLYVEWRVSRHARPVMVGLPWNTRQPLRVSLQRRGDRWRAGARGLWTPWVLIRGAAHCTTLELMGGAHGAAKVGSRRIAG